MTTSTILMLFVGGFALLICGAEAMVRGASRLAVAIGISPLVVGMTVVAYGTSAPEVAVTVQSMYTDPPRPDLAIGNVVGSNISNVLLVLGISATVLPLLVSRVLVRITVPFMIMVTGLVWYFSLDGQLDRLEGSLLLLGAILFTVFSVARSRRRTAAVLARKGTSSLSAPRSRTVVASIVNFLLVVVGLVALVLGARWLVEGAVEVARLLHVSELVVGLTVVAVGTSLPEVATSLVATLRGQRDIAVGNVVGSNIFNLLLVLGLCATLSPQPVIVTPPALRHDIPIMFAVAAACWPVFYTQWIISRWEGLAMLGFYAAYIVFLYLQSTQHRQLEAYQMALLYFVLPLTALALTVFTLRHWRSGSPEPQSLA